MKRPSLLHIIIALASAAGSLHAEPAAVPRPLTVAVLPFDGGDRLQDKGSEAAVLLGAKLSANASLWCVERAEIEKILGEHTIKLSGLADPNAAVQAGHVIGARVLITGRVIVTGDGALLVAKVMSTETSRVFGETATAPTIGSLDKATGELADKIGKLLEKQHAAFEVAAETPEARIARLKKITEGRPLPSVMVIVSERHLPNPVTDPAVETEMKKTLLALGFDVIDAKDPSKLPDITIKGEAFSETGTRRGQLVSARARVESQVQRRSDSKVLAVDRETSVAVDTAEGIAGKTALENAAAKLLDRLLVKIVAQ